MSQEDDLIASVCSTDLQESFNELKRYSVNYKMSTNQNEFGDNGHGNPLNKQFTILLSKINELLQQNYDNFEDYLKILIMKASILYEKAKLLLAENLLDICKIELEEALNLIKKYRNNPKVSFLYLRLVNYFTYVLCRQGEMQQAKEMLLAVIIESVDYKPVVFSTEDLFFHTKKDPKFAKTKLHLLTINNMQMLSWTYIKLNEVKANLQLQHEILQKIIESDEYDVFKWVDGCCQLAVGFISECDWANARYHLSAAENILSHVAVSNVSNNYELFAMEAELARTWIYYGLRLLETSRKTIFERKLNDVTPNNNIKTPLKLMTFNGIEIEKNLMPVEIIETCDESKTLFNSMHKWFKRARLYYTLRDYPLQYVNVCMDMAEYYRYMSFYETEIELQYQLQRKRYDTLEALSTLLREVRPNCYMSVNVELIKEIIEVQMDLMQLNLEKFYIPPQCISTDRDAKRCGKQLEAFSSIYKKLGAAIESISEISHELTANHHEQQDSKPNNNERTI